MAPRPSRGHAPLRNGAGGGGVQPSAAEGPLATTCDEWTGNDDFIAAGLSPERDDDGRDPFDVFVDASGGGGSQPPVNDVDPVDAVDSNTHTMSTGVNGNGDGNATPSSGTCGKRRSKCWETFDEVFEMINGNRVRVKAICKICKKVLSGRSAAGTGHILRHAKGCLAKLDRQNKVQSRLAFSSDGALHNWNYDPTVARTELCRLIARLDLPLGFGDTDAFEEYIVRAHNPRFVRSSRRTTTRDLDKLFAERRAMIRNCVHASSSVALTSDIWSGNAKEDYICVVAHYVNSNWELQKKIIGLRLIEVKHNGENISAAIASVVEEYGLIDKIFSITLDNASSNAKAMETLTPMFAGYLGPDPAPDDDDPINRSYSLVHQRCACHIINLVVKSALKRIKPYIEDFRTAINFLNSSNQRVAMFKNYCEAKGMRPRKFGLDMDVRWNATYLMLKHLVPYREVFSVFINSNYGSALLSQAHWHVAEKILEFLELFYDCTVTLSGVYYPTSPLVLHHVLEIATHLHACERDLNLRAFVFPMQSKFLKYWKDIPMLYSFAFILDPRAKLRGMQRVLHLLHECSGTDYTAYYADVKTELHKLFEKYLRKYGASRNQRVAGPTPVTGKRKQAWGRIFGGSDLPGPSSACSSSQSTASELASYLDSDCITSYEDGFDIILWWRDHKLTYPILAIMARDIMSVPVSTCSSESCFSLSGRILEEQRRSLKPEHVEMLTLLKDWELGEKREQHQAADNKEIEDAFENLFLDEPEVADEGTGG
ncbi:zinc finger BED domain-containing protein RICESLEEPER 2-like [Sorghum bicolor]|uniref:zinc finger BED domain-containing protein RICESLEEPER 2-like n=1 Tax=Sorghum bicolor TaxID=4558 RepID=UPI000B42455B|nr:zinc finger BED domain-containing protein RICESLEEPER 2-like [Sorghum bicolor]|eukprot:XP_021321373.1 zinc finger BED domain-containing protein RICESLEEPER 2-like [Sorghum bicolor]